MNPVNISYVGPTFLITSFIFLLLIFSMFSLAFVLFFKQKVRLGFLSVIGGIVAAGIFYYALEHWLVVSS
jgi:hypothetical protein